MADRRPGGDRGGRGGGGDRERRGSRAGGASTISQQACRNLLLSQERTFGRKMKEQPQVSTFHSHCVKVLRRRITHLGYPQKFAIYDRGDQESVARAYMLASDANRWRE